MKTSKMLFRLISALLAAGTFLPPAVAICAPLPVEQTESVVVAEGQKTLVPNEQIPAAAPAAATAEQAAPIYGTQALLAQKWQPVLDESYDLLTQAKRTSKYLRDPGNENYIQAATKLQGLLKDQPNSVEGLLLISHISRQRGVSAYAEEYFGQALSALAEKVADDDGCRFFHTLTQAILYTAGDARFSPDSEQYAAEGKTMAAHVRDALVSLKSSLAPHTDVVVLARILRAEAAAAIIIGDNAQATACLAEAAGLPLPADELMTAQKYAGLFQLASEGDWLWQAGSNATAEYLIRYAIDTGRFVSVKEAGGN